MLVTVELKQCSQRAANYFHGGKRIWYYSPVNGFSFREIGQINGGYHWFEASDWNLIKDRLAARGIKLTKRWHHIKTKREPEY